MADEPSGSGARKPGPSTASVHAGEPRRKFGNALATPIIVYAGPDVMSPAVPVIADAATEGNLALGPHMLHASIGPLGAHGCVLP